MHRWGLLRSAHAHKKNDARRAIGDAKRRLSAPRPLPTLRLSGFTPAKMRQPDFYHQGGYHKGRYTRRQRGQNIRHGSHKRNVVLILLSCSFLAEIPFDAYLFVDPPFERLENCPTGFVPFFRGKHPAFLRRVVGGKEAIKSVDVELHQALYLVLI